MNAIEVDAELQRLEEAYDALRGMDREAQVRALDWLHKRLESDATVTRTSSGKSASEVAK